MFGLVAIYVDIFIRFTNIRKIFDTTKQTHVYYFFLKIFALFAAVSICIYSTGTLGQRKQFK
jgi:hypothetical protein